MDELKAIHGVGVATAEKLNNAGYTTYEQVASVSPQQLSEEIEVSLSAAEQIVQSAASLLEPAQGEARKAVKQLRSPDEDTAEPVLANVEETTSVEVSIVEVEAHNPEMAFDATDDNDNDGIDVESEETGASETVESDIEINADEEATEEREVPQAMQASRDEFDTEALIMGVLNSPEAQRVLIESVGAEIAQMLSKKFRKKIAKKALSKKKFRKALIAQLIKELQKM